MGDRVKKALDTAKKAVADATKAQTAEIGKAKKIQKAAVDQATAAQKAGEDMTTALKTMTDSTKELVHNFKHDKTPSVDTKYSKELTRMKTLTTENLNAELNAKSMTYKKLQDMVKKWRVGIPVGSTRSQHIAA